METSKNNKPVPSQNASDFLKYVDTKGKQIKTVGIKDVFDKTRKITLNQKEENPLKDIPQEVKDIALTKRRMKEIKQELP